MAIIRNDRRAREEQAEAQKTHDEDDQLVTDYSWHPSLEEFDPQLTPEDWLALLDDPAVFDEDGLRAVECLHEFGVPTTLQQLSVRYRGTMGRYRRWLNTTAERVGRRLGIEAPEHDQFGNDEWWPLLYQRRGIGKAAANQHELRLRDELAQALDMRAAVKKKVQRRAEQAQTKERERQVRAQAEALRSRGTGSSRGASGSTARATPNAAEQRRAAQEARAEREARLSQITVDRTTESVPEIEAEMPAKEPKPRMTKAQAAVAARIAQAQQRAGGSESKPPTAASAPTDMPTGSQSTPSQQSMQGAANVTSQPTPASSDAQEDAHAAASEPANAAGAPRGLSRSGFPYEAVRTYLLALDREHPADEVQRPARVSRRPSSQTTPEDAVHLPLDYAVRYSNRLWTAFDLVGEAVPDLTAARVARLMGCPSVEPLQQVLNGEEIPGFELVDSLCMALGLNYEYLEAADEHEQQMPVFATVQELCRASSVAEVLGDAAPSRILVLKSKDDDQAANVVLCFGSLRCLLLDRHGVVMGADSEQDPTYRAFVALVNDLQEYALREGVEFGNRSVSAKNWQQLQQGRAWPGALIG